MSDDRITPATMRAVTLPRFGGPEVLEITERPWPQPVDDEVLVRVHAASVNPVDYKIRRGGYPRVGEDMLPIVMGRDLAGTIETCGTRAHNMLRHGDRVFAFLAFDRGAQAEYVVVKAVELVAMPATLDFAQAAAVPLAAMTAWQGLFDHGRLQPGQTALIQGGAGGVGHLAVQFANAKGARVITAVRGADVEFARGLGADLVIDRERDRFEDAGEVDLVLDLAGGEVQTRSVAVIRPGGALVSAIAISDEAQAAARERGVRVPDRWMATPNAEQLGEIADLIDAGKVAPTVARTFPLAEASAAHAALEAGGVRGKIVLTV
jgi:NADPH:quinone reductase-like Zn-dependent oxidoreductase